MKLDGDESGPKWTDKGNLFVSVALFACALVGIIVSYWQWQAARDQILLAERIARDSNADTRAALALSNRLAAAAEQQAAATRESIRSFSRLAQATEIQGKAAVSKLEMDRLPHLYIEAEFKGISPERRRYATFTIRNDSAYKIIGIKSEEMGFVGQRSLLSDPFQIVQRVATYQIEQGASRVINISSVSMWDERETGVKLLTGNGIAVFAMRLNFKDVDGRKHTVEQCIYQDADNDMRAEVCPYIEQRRKLMQ